MEFTISPEAVDVENPQMMVDGNMVAGYVIYIEYVVFLWRKVCLFTRNVSFVQDMILQVLKINYALPYFVVFIFTSFRKI